jgi:hypothetical protein
VSQQAKQRSTSFPILLPIAEESALPLLVPITSGSTDTRSIDDSSSVRADVNLVSSSGPNKGSSGGRGDGVWVSWKDIAALEYDHAVCERELASLADELANCRASLAALNSGFVQLQLSLAGATALQGICQVGITRVSNTLEKIDRRAKT